MLFTVTYSDKDNKIFQKPLRAKNKMFFLSYIPPLSNFHLEFCRNLTHRCISLGRKWPHIFAPILLLGRVKLANLSKDADLCRIADDLLIERR